VGPADDVFVVGNFAGNIANTCTGPTTQQAYLVPLNPMLGVGTPRCYFGGQNVVAFGIAVDGAGSVVLALTSNGAIQSSGFAGATVGPAVLNVLKLDAKWDNFRWAASSGKVSLAIQTAIAVDGMGDVLVTGATSQGFDAGGAAVGVGTFVFELAP
jgi:hypothetical protein